MSQISCLDRMATDAALRQRLRKNAHEYVSRERRLQQHIDRRLEFYRSLLPSKARQQTLPTEVTAVAKADGRYFQLQRQEPENKLRTAVEGKATADSLAMLKQLVEQQPAYLPALQQLGKQLNDLRQSRPAMRYLEQAIELDPQSARTLSEMGRACYLLDEDQKARELLEKAVTINRCYLAGWQYLLVLLERSKSPQGPHWARQAHEANPGNFALALLGSKLYPPDEAIILIGQLIDQYLPTFLAEELPLATAAFSQIIAEVTSARMDDPHAQALLRRACEAFPLSARLAYLLAQSLQFEGRVAEAQVYFMRCYSLRQTARTWSAEHPYEDGSIHFGQFAEHIVSLQERP